MSTVNSTETLHGLLMVGNFLSKWGRPRGVCEDVALHLSEQRRRIICTSSRKSRIGRVADMIWTTWADRTSYSLAQVEVYGGRAFVWAELVCAILRLARKPYILTLHGGSLPALAARQPARVTRLLTSAALVTVPSAYLRHSMKPYCTRLLEIPNGIEISRYEFRERQQAAPKLIWIRAFHKIYNPVLAVEALSYLLTEYPDASLTMAGTDKGDGSLEETRLTAARFGVAERVRLEGFVKKEEIPALLQTADIFLNTTTVDNTPVTVIEAMACGLCVISTDAGGMPYLIKNGRDGVLCRSGDARGVASAIKLVLENGTLAKGISRNGRSKAEGFDWKRVMSKWENALSTIHAEALAHESQPARP